VPISALLTRAIARVMPFPKNWNSQKFVKTRRSYPSPSRFGALQNHCNLRRAPPSIMADSSPHASSSHSNETLTPQYTLSQIAAFNKQLEGGEPQDILRWAIDHLDGLYQTTAFGL